MNKKQIEQKIQQSFTKVAPNDFDSIKSECDALTVERAESKQPTQRSRLTWRVATRAVAVAIVVVVTVVLLGYKFFGGNDDPFFISQDEALQYALQHLNIEGLTFSNVTDLQSSRETDNGATVYKITFVYNGTEYSFVVDAVKGNIVSLHQSMTGPFGSDNSSGSSAPGEQAPGNSSGSSEPGLSKLSEDELKQIVLDDVGVASDGQIAVEVKLLDKYDYEVYELSFSYGNYQYMYEIDCYGYVYNVVQTMID